MVFVLSNHQSKLLASNTGWIDDCSKLFRKRFSEGDGETNFNEMKLITDTEGWKKEEKIIKFSNKKMFHTTKFEFYDYETIERKGLTFINI